MLVQDLHNTVTETFKLRGFGSSGRCVMILRKDCLDRFELCDSEAGLAGIESLERLEHCEWRGIDGRWLRRCHFPIDPIEKEGMQQPLVRTRY